MNVLKSFFWVSLALFTPSLWSVNSYIDMETAQLQDPNLHFNIKLMTQQNLKKKYEHLLNLMDSAFSDTQDYKKQIISVKFLGEYEHAYLETYPDLKNIILKNLMNLALYNTDNKKRELRITAIQSLGKIQKYDTTEAIQNIKNLFIDPEGLKNKTDHNNVTLNVEIEKTVKKIMLSSCQKNFKSK